MGKNKQSSYSRKVRVTLVLLSIIAICSFVTALWAVNRLSSVHESVRVSKEDAQVREEELEKKASAKAEISDLMPRDFMDKLLQKARNRYGTQEALGLLEEEHFDALRANLLIAQGIPECRDLDIDKIDRWYTERARSIDKYMQGFSRTEQGQQFLAEKGRSGLSLLCTNRELYNLQNLRYVKNDIVLYDVPWHLFAHGVAEKQRGTCVNMSLAWKIIGDKLGWPLHIRSIPGHPYLYWEDETESFGIEATTGSRGFATKSSDKEYMQKLQLSIADKKSGRYMVNLTNKRLLASFVSSRADYWWGKGMQENAIGDLFLAYELDPITPNITTNLLICHAKYFDQWGRDSAAYLERTLGMTMDEASALLIYNDKQKASERRDAAMKQRMAGAARP